MVVYGLTWQMQVWIENCIVFRRHFSLHNPRYWYGYVALPGLWLPKMIYTVADEQDYHFKVLFWDTKRLKEPYATGLYHLNYGMVDLTTGKMKSEKEPLLTGDDLINEVVMKQPPALLNVVNCRTVSLTAARGIYKIGLAALKFFHPESTNKRGMTFDPKESLDMQGTNRVLHPKCICKNTIHFQKRRCFLNQSIIKTNCSGRKRKSLIVLLTFPGVIAEAARVLTPHTLPTIVIPWPKNFIDFIMKLEFWGLQPWRKNFRLGICKVTAEVLQRMKMLGIDMLERM